ncbi:calpain-A-like [Periplaneta americana]|uniref:calpain-A-like n=1 Tax=Periplaneta americana TaxID=6978 RepID=UPI0037E6FE12
MGCGYSSSFVVAEQQPPPPPSTKKPTYDTLKPPPVPIVSAKSKHPLETRIVQDEVVDTCVERPDPEETRLNVLPEGEFIDGMLGLWDESFVSDLVGGLAEGELFEDPDFPANSSSLSYSDPDDDALADIAWLRPHELSEDPNMFVDGVSRSDVKQGDLGDCWFLSACAALSRKPELIEKVVPPDQPLSGEDYKGLVYIRFWRFGEWVTVYINDRLPVRNGSLLYASCTDSNEFWVAFVEKAYAKLHGSYEALAGGHAIEAFVDLTGGLAEQLDITPKIFRKLRVAFNHGAFITCARKGEWQDTKSCKSTEVNGLVQGHAYTVTDVRRLETDSFGTVQMVRIRNPWGDASEWTGAWSDGDSRWQNIDEEMKQRMGVTAMDDGEFWMEFPDFQPEFQELTIATLGPDFDSDGVTDMPGQVLFLNIILLSDYEKF